MNRDIEQIKLEFPFYIKQITSKDDFSFKYRDLFQILYLTRGSIRYSTAGRTHRVSNKGLLFVPPGTGVLLILSDQIELIQIAFGQLFLDQIAIRSRDDLLLSKFNPDTAFLKESGSVFFLELTPDSDISEVISQLNLEYQQKRGGFESMIRLKFMELLLILKRFESPQPVHDNKPSDKKMDEIIDYIHNHYTENFTLNDMAGLSGFNPSYFSRAFKHKAGMPLFEYVNNMRIRKACILLKRTDLSIIEIAYSVGYNNISFFNRYFRKIMKMSPREYRIFIKK
ncbi:HTH-type transcriptional activator RhaR [subsurface metagenome]